MALSNLPQISSVRCPAVLGHGHSHVHCHAASALMCVCDPGHFRCPDYDCEKRAIARLVQRPGPHYPQQCSLLCTVLHVLYQPARKTGTGWYTSGQCPSVTRPLLSPSEHLPAPQSYAGSLRSKQLYLMCACSVGLHMHESTAGRVRAADPCHITSCSHETCTCRTARRRRRQTSAPAPWHQSQQPC